MTGWKSVLAITVERTNCDIIWVFKTEKIIDLKTLLPDKYRSPASYAVSDKATPVEKIWSYIKDIIIENK